MKNVLAAAYVAAKLADIPLGRLSDQSEANVVALLSTILARPEPEARLDLLRRAEHLPLRDQKRWLLRRLIAHLEAESPEEAALALAALLWRMMPEEWSEVGRQLRKILPRRKRLLALLQVLKTRLGPYGREAHRKVAEVLLSALEADAGATPQYLALGAELWDYQQLALALLALSKRDLLYHEVMMAGQAAVRACIRPGSLEPLLQKEPDWRLRRLGLEALVVAASPENGWTEDRRGRLELYRQDESPGVAGPASFVFPP